jgi:hypothetical protein
MDVVSTSAKYGVQANHFYWVGNAPLFATFPLGMFTSTRVSGGRSGSRVRWRPSSCC